MDQILNRPEIQSAVLPFIAGLLIYIVSRKFTTNAWISAVFIAFLLSAGLINGLTFTPLTGTRKIILLILFAFVIAGSIHHFVANPNVRRAAMYSIGIFALVWVFWAIALRMEMSAMAIIMAGAIALVLWLVWSFERIGDDDAQLHGSGFSLLLGTGLSATAGASALLGQLALSLAAASGGAFLAWVLVGKATYSSNNSVGSTLPYALAAALLGLAAVIFASVPWYALIPLAAIPLATSYVPKFDARFINALVSSLPGLIIALAVSFLVWKTGSSDSGY